MDDRHKMRASDTDRQEVVERLRVALDEGRLKMDEYVQRMERAYEAVTYGDLDALHADLPAASPPVSREAAPPATTPPVPASAVTTLEAVAAKPSFIADLPTSLKVLWTIWLTAVSINVVVWVLVSGTSGRLIYPWPLWVAGPYGAALFAWSVGAVQIRRSRRAAARRLPRGQG